MYPLFETIRVVDGNLMNIHHHNERFTRSRKNLFHLDDKIYLEDIIDLPPYAKTGLYKCRIVYTSEIISVDFEPYTPRTIQSLKLVTCDSINYSYKYLDRRVLMELKTQRGEADDILIIKEGLLTDTSYSNILLFDGQSWVTPKTPLLAGTLRNSLISNGIAREKFLTVKHLKQAKKIRLINAMLPFDAEIDIIPENIII